ncbi:hypothetical protein C7S13_4106 [Burkholderia cepacia]|nr:hypothetical protein [Burkholderia cepacia]
MAGTVATRPCRAAASAAPLLRAQQRPTRLLLAQQATHRHTHRPFRATPAPRAAAPFPFTGPELATLTGPRVRSDTERHRARPRFDHAYAERESHT